MDRISDLPTHIIEKILGSLPMADAVRTSILSTKWRQKWEEAPQLVFDRSFVSYLQKRRGPMSDSDLMTMIISEVLVVHSGSVNKFVLSIPQLESCPEIDRIIRVLAKRGVHDFKLSILSEGFHKLPSHLFAYNQLRSLKLYSCVVETPPGFGGFNKLATLEFQKVVVDPDFFEAFIAKCPQLERLVLSGCICESPCVINLNAPNLKFFNYSGEYASICFKDTPLLEVASVYNPAGEHPQDGASKMKRRYLDEVLSGLHSIQSLSIDNYFLKTIIVRDTSRKLPNGLNQLKILEAFDLCLTDEAEFSCLLGLIRSCPNLEELRIEMIPAEDFETSPSLPQINADGIPVFMLNKLRKVNFHGFGGTSFEMELIKFLLSKLSGLRIMYVQPPAGMEDREQLKLVKRIVRFQRASPNAEIIYGD